MSKLPNLSPNFSKKSRNKGAIKFVIIHYTGMQSEIESFKRLTNPKLKVSCHYLINRKGSVKQLVQENKVAWHAGKSKWKKFNNLNYNSLGIELVNKGHRLGYENFTSLQIKSLIKICKLLKKKYRLKKENFLGHSDIAPMRKIDPGEKFPWKKLNKFDLGLWVDYQAIKFKNFKKNKSYISKLFFKNLHKIGYRYFKVNKRTKNDLLIIKAFQRRFTPNSITGKIDQKTLNICHFLANLS